DRCGFWLHPPGPVCRRCFERALTPTAVSGRGRVRTFTVNHQPWFPSLPVPYVLAIVELEEQPGLQFLTRLVDCPADTVRAGLARSAGGSAPPWPAPAGWPPTSCASGPSPSPRPRAPPDGRGCWPGRPGVRG